MKEKFAVIERAELVIQYLTACDNPTPGDWDNVRVLLQSATYAAASALVNHPDYVPVPIPTNLGKE